MRNNDKTPDATAGWLGHQRIQTKLAIAFGALLVVLLLVLVAVLQSAAQQTEARQWTLHTYEVIDAEQELVIAVRDVQVAVRGYTLRASDKDLADLDDAELRAKAALTVLSDKVADNPRQVERVQAVHAAFEHYVEQNIRPHLIRLQQIRAEGGGLREQRVLATGEDQLNAASVDLARIAELTSQLVGTERGLMDERLKTLAKSTRQLQIILIGAVIAVVVLTLAALWFALHQITRPISQLTALMGRLTEGDRRIEVPGLGRRDEVGAIARALNAFKHLVIETQQTSWVKNHVAELSAQLQQQKDREVFANIVTATVAPLVEAGVAVFYAADEKGQQLSLLGHYGFRQRKHVTTQYALGEGLVGQCARERKPIQLDQIPPDYTAIHSGTGEALPATLVVLPLVSADRLLGVLEFAAFTPFTATQTQLLDNLLPVVSLSFENLNRALVTQTLLAETQRQSDALRATEEELRSQQDELRNQNQLLENQSSQLKASEEELRVQAEELQATNEELREQSEALSEQKQQVEASERAAQDKAEALARASQYKSEFLANMSHELRTPLNSLLILARGLADNDDKHLSPDEVESAEVIHSAGTSLLRLINDILDLSKIEAGKMDLAIESVRISELTTNLTRTFRSVARDKHVNFTIEQDPSLPTVFDTDIGKLEQILNNLLSNAFKFTAQGEVTLRIAATRNQQIAFHVSDTGIGIPAEKFGRVFQAFEQVDGSTRRQYGGTGLGLSIARSMAQLMGGDITLVSEPGKGSTFTVTLPLSVEFMRPEAHEAATLTTPTRAPSIAAAVMTAIPAATVADDREQLAKGDSVILIIEDDIAFARILLDTVRKRGQRGLVATDGESGLALAQRFKPAGILLDVMLPGLDGWGVIEKLKEQPDTRAIPVHFISATEERGPALDAGAVGFLTKPVDRKDLSTALERLQHFEPGRLRRVLVIDDDSGARLAVRKLLSSQQVEVLEAADAETALVLLREAPTTGHIDCVVLDLGLPGMDGFSFLEHTASLDAPPPVVVYSGRDLTREETLKLRTYTDSIVIKGARSPERLLDEVSLFLHSLRPMVSPAAAAVQKSDPGLSGKSVLVVDDDVRNMFAMSKALRAKGLNVVMAQDGHKALKQLESISGIDLVLMDIMMPGMDGYDTMREIRKVAAWRQLPIIALTAKAMRGDREKCIEAGANDYLAKPVDLDKLFSMMRVWLSAT
jgi:signal transduction histidine kinase/DNA-binding response OmpR family regulator/CHASE3 domain sensor protein